MTIRTCLTLAVDTYSESGQLISTKLCMRASSVLVSAYEVFDTVDEALPAEWRQVTYAEALDALAQRSADKTDPWQQLSMF